MASIQKFEDLICWKKARELANFIYDITDKKEWKDFDLKRQIRRAATSPMSNIAEGFGRYHAKDNKQFYSIAKGIKAEVGYVRQMLYKLQNQNLVTYFRKKDRIKGWYISYWTFNQRGVPELAMSIKRNKLQALKERLQREEENKGLFYICPKFCSRMNFEDATEVEFKCPECGQSMQHQDNERTIDHLRENITGLENEAVMA